MTEKRNDKKAESRTVFAPLQSRGYGVILNEVKNLGYAESRVSEILRFAQNDADRSLLVLS